MLGFCSSAFVGAAGVGSEGPGSPWVSLPLVPLEFIPQLTECPPVTPVTRDCFSPLAAHWFRAVLAPAAASTSTWGSAESRLGWPCVNPVTRSHRGQAALEPTTPQPLSAGDCFSGAANVMAAAPRAGPSFPRAPPAAITLWQGNGSAASGGERSGIRAAGCGAGPAGGNAALAEQVEEHKQAANMV